MPYNYKYIILCILDFIKLLWYDVIIMFYLTKGRLQKVHKKVFSIVFLLNTLFQGLLSLIFPIGAALLFSYFAVSFWSFHPVTYAISVPIGAVLGIFSMIRFILSTMRALESLESERDKKTYATGTNNEEKQT